MLYVSRLSNAKGFTVLRLGFECKSPSEQTINIHRKENALEKNTIKHQICKNALEVISKMLEWGHTAGGTRTTGVLLWHCLRNFSVLCCVKWVWFLRFLNPKVVGVHIWDMPAFGFFVGLKHFSNSAVLEKISLLKQISGISAPESQSAFSCWLSSSGRKFFF